MIANFQIITDRDRREAAAIEARRRRDEERKKRIFDPRARLIGIDVECLDRQVQERKKKDQDEKIVEKIFSDQKKKADHIAMFLEHKDKEERLKLEKEINEYRKSYQRREDSREYDLNDPGYKLNQKPCRGVEDDPKLGISAVQKFEGEDLEGPQRRQIQHKEFRSWLEQQMKEKEAAENDQKAAEQAFKAALLARDYRAAELEQIEKECKRKLEIACIKYNEALMIEKNCEKQKRAKEEYEDNMADICNFLNSDLMTENRNVAQSNLGPKKKIASLYKGLTEEDERAIRAEQKAQIEEMRIRRQHEKRSNMEMDSYIDGVNHQIFLMDQENAIKRKNKFKELFEENKRLAEEQLNRKKLLDETLYSSVPSDEFYEQFNKGSR